MNSLRQTFSSVRCLSQNAVFVCLFVAAGCGDTLPPPADADRARPALTAALEAWKSGADSTALLKQAPPIRVADEDWFGGSRLIDYSLGEGRAVGPQWRCETQLSIQDRNGRTVRRTVKYIVATADEITVIRED